MLSSRLGLRWLSIFFFFFWLQLRVLFGKQRIVYPLLRCEDGLSLKEKLVVYLICYGE